MAQISVEDLQKRCWDMLRHHNFLEDYNLLKCEVSSEQMRPTDTPTYRYSVTFINRMLGSHSYESFSHENTIKSLESFIINKKKEPAI